jgi:hypothetical protein
VLADSPLALIVNLFETSANIVTDVGWTASPPVSMRILETARLLVAPFPVQSLIVIECHGITGGRVFKLRKGTGLLVTFCRGARSFGCRDVPVHRR